MQLRLKSLPNAVVNWSIPGQLIDQIPAAVVVVNGPPLRGPLITCRPTRRQSPRPLPAIISQSLATALGYAVTEPAESITRLKRHRLTAAKPRVLTTGGADVLHF
jgi:hypothetical protein